MLRLLTAMLALRDPNVFLSFLRTTSTTPQFPTASSYEQDVTRLSQADFERTIRDSYSELLQRKLVVQRSDTPDGSPLPRSNGFRQRLSELPLQNLKILVHDVFREMTRRYYTPSNFLSTLASPIPRRFTPNTLVASGCRTPDTPTRVTSKHPLLRSSTTDVSELYRVPEPSPRPTGPRAPNHRASPLNPYRGVLSRARSRTQSPYSSPSRGGSPRYLISPPVEEFEPFVESDSDGISVASSGSTLARLHTSLEQRDRTIEELTGQVNASKDDVAILKAMIAELKAEVSSLRSSPSSWQTAPTRSYTVQQPAHGPYIQQKQLLLDACRSECHAQALCSLRGNPAQIYVQLMQEILDGSDNLIESTNNTRFRNQLRRLLVKLCRDSSLLPPSFFVEDVQCTDREPFSGGAFADIFAGECRQQRVALKRLRVFQSRTSQEDNDTLRLFYKEAIIWRQLRHPNILPFWGVDRRTFPTGLCMVSPLMQHGNVLDTIDELERRGEVVPTDRWLSEIAEGLRYLHEEQVVHGDVRGPNVLIDDNLHAQLGDFGLAFFSDTSTASLGSHLAGAARWMSPELITCAVPRPTFASDVYAFGCVCVEIHTRLPPFSEIPKDIQVIAKVQQGICPARPRTSDGKPIISDDIWNLVQNCWRSNPGDRPSMKAIVNQLELRSRFPTLKEDKSSGGIFCLVDDR